MTWDDIKSDWSTGWNYMWRAAQDSYQKLVEADPTGYTKKVEAFLAELTGARTNLDGMKAKLPNPPQTSEDKALVEKYQALEKRYQDLAAGFYSETQPADKTQMGIIPSLIAGGLAVSAAAAAWAVPAYEYAANLREQTALADKELEARIAASREGRTLQKSTLPERPPGPSLFASGGGGGALVVVGLAGVAGLFVLPKLLKKQ